MTDRYDEQAREMVLAVLMALPQSSGGHPDETARLSIAAALRAAHQAGRDERTTEWRESLRKGIIARMLAERDA